MIRFTILIILIICSLISCHRPMDVVGMRGNNRNLKEIEASSEYDVIISPYREELEEKMNEVLCRNGHDMVKARPESALGNFVSDACLDIARRSFDGNIDAAMFNTGGLRSALAAGDITVEDIYQLMPFDNELVVLELPHNEALLMLEYLAMKGGEPVADIEMVFAEGLVQSARIGGSPLEVRNYTILTSDYLSNGGDQMTFFTEGHRLSRENLGIKVRDALITFCQELGSSGAGVTPLDYHTDGRIKEE